MPELPRPAPSFICVDCKAPVYDALGQARERCMVCQWIEEIADPEDKARLREWFKAQEERL
jgi:hypothetical protein